MPKTLYWLQCGGCGGDTMSALSAETPDLVETLGHLDLEVLWHPSISVGGHLEHRRLIESIVNGKQRLDILCVEGAVIRGPGGTGMYDKFAGEPKKNLLARLARQAQFVVAMGTCASFGGIGADSEVEATGVQFHRAEKGGFLGTTFVSQGGTPVINLPGCPCHTEVIVGALTALATGEALELTGQQTPVEWYGLLIHQGCVRNEYHEYRVEESDFGKKGCLFFHLGCHGPLAHGPCNKFLWGRRSSKTRVGVPCFGCTRPDFPQPHPFFYTRNIADIPLELPEGVDRAHYLAYKGMAAAAAPKRLQKRETRV
ncbi:MAG: NADH:ubiquinone oxidoreductase [Candidatus Riflebacteria bacterium]|nr:NADH:ubiquinone oxidoreductase [Candidatus Riflebacteria bacterium]